MKNTYILCNHLLVESSLIIESTVLNCLEQALVLVQQGLQAFASKPDFVQKMVVAFGEAIEVDSLKAAWLARDYSIVPVIEIRNAADINGANGAYGAATNRIYLSREYLQANQGNIESIVGLLLEEIGHQVDSILNHIDSAGDEGAIFSALVRGESLSSEQLQYLRAEEDKTVIRLDGQNIEIEKQDFTGTAGNDNIAGTAGDDLIQGLGGNDILSGLAGNDTLFGDDGNDTLLGGTGNDSLNGGNGDDYLAPGTGVDVVIGGAGIDTLDIDNRNDTANTTISYTDSNNGTITGGTNNGTTFKEIERTRIYTGSGNDNIDLSATNYNGFWSADVNAGAGNDIIVGGSGFDVLRGEAGNDTIRGGGARDDLYGGSGDDVILGEVGSDNIYGETGNDTLNGGEGDDYLAPGTGVDVVIGGTGIDTVDIDNRNDTANTTITYNDPNNGTIAGGSNGGTTFREIERARIYTGSGDDNIDLSATNYNGFWSADVNAGAGNDIIVGGSGFDVLRGEAGNDTIRGGGARDDLYGGSGDDVILGEAGSDNIYGEAGNDTLNGGEGDDYLAPGTGVDTVIGGIGIDRLAIDNRNDTANTTITYNDPNNGTITGGSNDGTTFREIERADILTGSGNDNIDLSATNYNGFWSADVSAGGGNDTIVGGSGIDVLRGEAGNDTIRGGGARDDLYGGNGDDLILGEAGSDNIYGEAGNDTLNGGEGDDYLAPGTGVDTVIGGIGIDRLAIDNRNDTANTTITYNDPNNGTITGGSNNGTTFREIERADILTGSGNDNIDLSATNYNGFWSADVSAGGGNDTIVGGSGIDVLRGEAGNDTIRGGGARDDLYGGSGDDVILGEVGNDNIYGEVGNDTLNGGEGDDYLAPGTGVDVVIGGIGIDTVDIDNRNDIAGTTITYNDPNNGTITGGSNNGTTFREIERARIYTGSGDDNIDLSATNYNGFWSADVSAGAGNDSIVGGSGLDVLGGEAGNDTIRGGGARDDLYGGSGDDLILGEAGSDNIYGEAGNDTLNGGEGDDYLVPGTGVDVVIGGTGIDRLAIDNRNDTADTTITYNDPNNGTITGGSNNGTTFREIERADISTGSGSDNIDLSATNYNGFWSADVSAGAGNDSIVGGSGIDVLRGEAGNDTIRGGGARDDLYGGSGNDVILGEAGNDNIYGEAGDDTLNGVNPSSNNPGIAERDTLSGGTGSDRFILGDSANIYYDDRNTLTNGNNDYATLTDFNPSEDKVQLQGSANNYRLEVSGSNTNLYIDKAGSEPDELIAVFQNVTGLNLNSSAFEYVAPINEVAFGNGTYSVSENCTAQVTLTRAGSSVGEISVTLALTNGTATAPADYNNSSIRVTFADGETSKIVTIPIVDDTRFEANETINLALTNPSSGVTLRTQSTAVFTIIDNDSPVPGTLAFSRSTYSVNEDGTSVIAVTITRTGGSDGEVSATLTPSNGTATAPTDYNSNPITVTFADGETSKTVTIPIVDDTVFESNETINLALSNPTNGATLGTQNTATLTILNNDTPQQGILAFTNPTYSVNEDGTPITTVTVTRTGGSDGEVGATISLSNGTATAPSDYNSNPITVTFASGDTAPKTISIPITNDTLVEGTETINLTLTSPTGGATIGNQSTAFVAIVDDDTQLNFSTGNYTVREDGTAVTDIIVTRTGRATGAVSATITFTDGTATGCACGASSVNNDFHNVAFVVTLADGETSKVIPVELASLGGTNAIRIRNDVKVEGDESFTINLTNPTGGATIGNQGSASVKILDDDVALDFSAANFSIRENGEAVTAVTVTRTGRLTGVVGATINLTDGTATAASDYNNTPITISFADGETSKTVFIPVNNDITVEPNETVNLSLSNPTGGAVLGTQNTAVLTILDNGQAPTLGVSINKDIVAENAGNNAAVGTVTRNVITNQDLVVTLASSDTTEATVPTQVTILAGQASATFAINAVDDGVADGAQTTIITASATRFSSGSRNLTVTDINVPDLVVSNLSATTPLLSGKQAIFSYKVENKGLAQATTTEENPSIDRIYLSTDNKLDSSDTLLSEFQFKGNFPVGQFYERNVPFFVPRTTGQYYLIAQTDATNTVNEGRSIGDSNNTTILPISVAAAYRAIVSTNTEIGIAGQSVTLRGQALSNGDNSPVPFEFVTIAVKNNGFVRELSAFTDANGNFTSTFKPLAREAGQYQVNAYFPNNPSEDTAAEDSFKLLGMRFGNNNAAHKVIADNVFTAQVNLENLTDVDLNGLTYTVEGAPSDWNIQVNTPSTLAGLGSNTISYTITAPNDSAITQDTFNIKLTSTEGVTASLPVNVNLERIVPRLVASTNLVSSGMLRGNQTLVEFEVKNEGGAVAENIDVLLPNAPWLKLASPAKINALAPGESTKVTLLLTPDADFPLVPYRGNIFLDVAGNDGDLSLPVEFRAVSQAVGDLRVNVVDDYTFYVEGAPKVQNAKVQLLDPWTQNVIAEGVTDANGSVFFDDVSEGTYTLKAGADKHGSYNNLYTITPGSLGETELFLQRQTVNYQWTVVPTEIQDEYNITLESVFETDVPVPVVTMTPGNIDLAKLSELPGEVNQIDFTITNHGLIAAENVELFFPSNHLFWEFKPLITDIGILPAKSSLTVPVVITNRGLYASQSSTIDVAFSKIKSIDNNNVVNEAKISNSTPDFNSNSPLLTSSLENNQISILAASGGDNSPSSDAGNYYNPNNKPKLINPVEWSNSIPPDWSPDETVNAEFGIGITGARFYESFLGDMRNFFGSQTRDIWKLYLDSSPNNIASKQTYTNGDQIVEGTTFVAGFKNATITQNYVNKVWDIATKKIQEELIKNFQNCEIETMKWDIQTLLPEYYVYPNYNYSTIQDTWVDRNGYPAQSLPSDFVSLDYTPSLFIPGQGLGVSIPELLAGGVGYGGTVAFNSSIDPQTGVLQPGTKTKLWPDSREIKGHIELVQTGSCTYELRPDKDLKIIVNDTVDFLPGNLGGYLSQWLGGTNTLFKLEANGAAFDVPFEVVFSPDINPIGFNACCDLFAGLTWSYPCGPYDNFQTGLVNFLNASECCPPGLPSGGTGGIGGIGVGGGSGFIGSPSAVVIPCVPESFFTPQTALFTENVQNSVCARVKLQIDQEAVMTRSAFLGALEIDNGNITNLENLSVTLQVKDAQGNVVNDLFGITNPTLKNITAVDGTGILRGDDANTPQDEGIGAAEWTFIPTNLAAPQAPTTYTIAGTLSYTDNGQVINVPLLSTPITVLPQAELFLDYFQSRNVYGDDPFTDATEVSVPFDLAVLVRNQGFGDAKNLRITSSQPKIIENEKGLLIDFNIIGSQLNGENASPSLSVNFGDIKAGETAVANWLLKSTLQGKFIEYKATFEHVNGLGNKELSLLKEVKVRELIKKVQANGDSLPDFLVNDQFDANFTPDTLYFSSGGTAPVKAVTNATTDGAATFEDLTVQVSANVEAGWSYLRLLDPGNGQFQVKRVVRADGTEVVLDNVWTTDRTFPATGRPTYENILHLIDNNITAGAQTYTITYTTGDQTPPKVREIVDVDPNPRNTPINTIDVVFTEPIKASTFDNSDIGLTLDGVAVNTNNVSISQVNSNTYRIGNLQGVTGNVGQYQLSVNAAGVQDFEGLSGIGVVNESWVFTGDRPAVAGIVGFTSTRLNTSINNPITVTFTEAINPSSFDFNDLFLNRDGGGDLIKNTVTIAPINSTTYQISNLGDLTSVDGEYTFLVNARGVVDTDGNTGVGAKGFTWTLNTNAPRLQSITDVTSPRNTKVSSLDIAFSKAIDSTTFDLSDIILTRDGTTNLITSGANLTQLNDTTYRFNGLTGLQSTDGTYSLAVVGSGIKDVNGNVVTNSLTENWTLDTIAPASATNVQITNGVVNESGQIRVNSTSIDITGSLSETGLKVYIRDKNLNQSLAQASVSGTSFNASVQLSGAGARELEIQVVDAAGNTTTTPLNLFADITKPAITQFFNLPETPTLNPVNYIDVKFSEQINLSTFNRSDITLTRNGETVTFPNTVTIEYLSDTTYRINGLNNLTNTPGNYQLRVDATTIQDNAGNNGDIARTASFTISAPVTPGVTFTQTNGSTTVIEASNSDTYSLVLRTQPASDVTITLAPGNQITSDKTTLTFTATNWNVPQTITITAVNDTTPEGNHNSTITHSISSNDGNYNSLTLPNINIAIQDNDVEIRGVVWNDVNGNSIKDNGESLLTGWTVYLDTNNNSQLDAGETSTLTDSQGNYTFNDLRPGTHNVAQLVQDGWKQTYPIINVTTTASTAEIFTPSAPLSTISNTQATTATNLINLNDFVADTRFTNIKGQGYATVIIDTGADLDHPLFGADNNGDGIADRIIYQYDFADKDNNASDKSGHGSHIASIAASIAPGANIIVLKVFKDSGSGSFSDLEAALQWVNQNADKYNIASVNLSVGDGQNWSTGNSRYGIGDELAAIASKNIIVAAAAGNSFYQFNSNPGLAYPAADPNTIAVGAVWADNFGTNKTFGGGAVDNTTDSDRIASFSQRHATLLDVFAPGIFITGANATGGTQTMGGTSQAVPFISGIAVLAQQIATEKLGRQLTLTEFRTLLDNTSVLINDGDNENDNVNNTGLNFPRVNMLALAEGILKLNSQTPTSGNSNPNPNSSDDPLYLPSGSTKLNHTVTLTAGQIASDINFGNQLINKAPTLTNISKSGNENTVINFSQTDFTTAFNDADGNSLNKIQILSLPNNGVLQLNGTNVVLNQEVTLSNLNNLTFTPNPNFDGTVSFNWNGFDGEVYALNPASINLTVFNVINGTSNNETINGTNRNDVLDGGAGNDRLVGGNGDDIYIVDSSRDVVVEAPSEGKDTVKSAANYTLTNNIEDLVLTGASNISGTGNDLDNTITGNSGNNTLKGLGGNDILLGGAGSDILVGGAGNDILTGGADADQFLFGSGAAFNTNAFGVDTITDFNKAADKIVLSKASFTALSSAVNTSLAVNEFATIQTNLANEVSIAGGSGAKIVYNSTTGNLLYNQDGTAAGLGSGGLFATFTTLTNVESNNFFVQA